MNTPNPVPVPSLETVQRWMLSVITCPGGIAAGVESAAARNALPVSMKQLEQVISPSAQCTSEERLAVYGNAYFARLLECLEAEYPTVHHLVGADAFRAFAHGYLQECPSTSYTLNMLGKRFPDYLARTRPVEESEHAATWSDFIIEVAQLERLYAEVFDGPGEEKELPFSTDAIGALPAERWGQLRLVTSASLQLRRFVFPVHECISTLRRNEPVLPGPPHATWLVVNRRDYIVRREAVSELQWLLLRSLQAGWPLGEALQQTLETASPETLEEVGEELIRDLGTWFQHWAAAGYFSRVLTEPELPATAAE